LKLVRKNKHFIGNFRMLLGTFDPTPETSRKEPVDQRPDNSEAASSEPKNPEPAYPNPEDPEVVNPDPVNAEPVESTSTMPRIVTLTRKKVRPTFNVYNLSIQN
jgi:hypothetical protein